MLNANLKLQVNGNFARRNGQDIFGMPVARGLFEISIFDKVVADDVAA